MFASNSTNAIYDAALALFYPQACAVCAASVESRFDGVVCDRCWTDANLFAIDDPLCWKCGAPARTRVTDEQREQVRCRRCDESSFTVARACGLYEGALRANVIALKRDPRVARRLALLLHEVSRRAPLNSATLIVPVPLHPQREKQRGFNQAAELAGSLSKLTGLPVADQSLCRRQHTGRHRAGMDAQARRESVENAFEVAQPRVILDEQVLLIDDVFTTGATVSACARTLRDAGAREVFVLTVARPAAQL